MKKRGLLSDKKLKTLIIERQLFHHLLAELSKKFSKKKMVYYQI